MLGALACNVCESTFPTDVKRKAGEGQAEADTFGTSHGNVSVCLGSLYLPQDLGPFLINHHTG